MFERSWKGHWHWGLVGALLVELLLVVGLFICYRSCDAEVCQGCLYIPFAPSIVLFSWLLKSVTGFLGVLVATLSFVVNILFFSAVLTPIVAGIRALPGLLKRKPKPAEPVAAQPQTPPQQRPPAHTPPAQHSPPETPSQATPQTPQPQTPPSHPREGER